MSYYFYQFHVETVDHVQQIGDFLKGKKRDPLLKICVGVFADHTVLDDQKKIAHIEEIFRACDLYEGFVPILHFTFKHSPKPTADVRAIKTKMPFVHYIQTNDIKSSELETILLACKLFLADIPLSDSNFALIHDPKFRNAITKYKAFLLLDNSKGTGVREPKERLMEKINELLKYGLNQYGRSAAIINFTKKL